jgi:hypothetical protein
MVSARFVKILLRLKIKMGNLSFNLTILCGSQKTVRILKNRLSDIDQAITGFNVGMNCGESAGQTIF